MSVRRERFISLGKFDSMFEQYGGENFGKVMILKIV